MFASSVTSCTVRFPLGSNALLFVVTFLVVPRNSSSSVNGNSFSTTVGSGVGARRDCWNPGPRPLVPDLKPRPAPPPPPKPPPSIEKISSSSIPPIPPPLALAKFLKMSSAELKRKPLPPPGPLEKWNDRAPPPGIPPPKPKPPGIPPSKGDAPAPPPGDGAGPPRRRYSRPNWS